MSYQSIAEMSASLSLRSRITAAAAAEGVQNPDTFVAQNIWTFSSQPGWGEAWDYAKDVATVNVNPDTGARTDVINDSMILAAVQDVVAKQQATI